jgi:hypothetical protein
VIDTKAAVTRLVDAVMNGRNLDLLDELCTPQLAVKLRIAFAESLDAFPDWRQELVELVAEDATVVARLRCHGTHTRTWQGLPPTGSTMSIDEVYFFRLDGAHIRGMWGLEDTWTRIRQLAGENITLGELGSLSDPTAH